MVENDWDVVKYGWDDVSSNESSIWWGFYDPEEPLSALEYVGDDEVRSCVLWKLRNGQVIRVKKKVKK